MLRIHTPSSTFTVPSTDSLPSSRRTSCNLCAREHSPNSFLISESSTSSSIVCPRFFFSRRASIDKAGCRGATAGVALSPARCMTPNNHKILQNGFVLAATIVSGHTRFLGMTDDEKWIEKYVQAALEVRGELMLSESNFEKLNRSLVRNGMPEVLSQHRGDGYRAGESPRD